MEKKGLTKVDLIFEKVDPKEVLTKAFKMSNERSSRRCLIQDLKDAGVQVSRQD